MRSSQRDLGVGVALEMSIGAALRVILDDLILWVGVGLAIETAIGFAIAKLRR
ncbi:hypothetical protein H6G17_26220 [Chroococcidiopsis sp. FACHB-1243]|uniref:hypothetical protein n=1 Tax=Chroococcidiopsis sp. [FACHB-1243] TaxID=2692781 RepID=UPI00177DE4F8|nr:hypothetical protein [Chroococcidiopsis sp. [FACHB-1243]]MBD2308968.1 hypothetical protein [Chroococcidiopsis sp. [FACHB-1243]]